MKITASSILLLIILNLPHIGNAQSSYIISENTIYMMPSIAICEDINVEFVVEVKQVILEKKNKKTIQILTSGVGTGEDGNSYYWESSLEEKFDGVEPFSKIQSEVLYLTGKGKLPNYKTNIMWHLDYNGVDLLTSRIERIEEPCD